MEKDKHQVIFIRGGEVFDNQEEFYYYVKNRPFNPYQKKKSWRDWLEWGLSEDFDAFTPQMPNKQWADYNAWKIWFERYLPYIKKKKSVKLILIGHSLGGLFLAKYLSENKFPKKIDQLHFVAAVYSNDGLVDEKIGNFDFDKTKLKNVGPQAEKIFIYQSTDDPITPMQHALEYKKRIKKAKLFTFNDRQHFNQPAFMELLQTIKKNL